VIPIRLHESQHPVVASEKDSAGEALRDDLCPACDLPLGDGPVSLVVVAPIPRGKIWGTGAAVAVHRSCVEDGAPE
jgi:hypothetical protein